MTQEHEVKSVLIYNNRGQLIGWDQAHLAINNDVSKRKIEIVVTGENIVLLDLVVQSTLLYKRLYNVDQSNLL